MKIKPPSSTAGSIGVAVGALAAAGVVGGIAGANYMPEQGSPGGVKPKQAGAAVGAGLAIFATGLAGLVASEFAPQRWGNLSRIVALTGVGSVGVVGALTAAQSLRDARAALASGPQAPALPAGPPTSPAPAGAQTYQATSAESGRTLNMIVGDSVAVSLPAGQGGQEWVWTATPDLIAYAGRSLDSAGNEVNTFQATGAGSGMLVASLSVVATGAPAGASFSLNVNVSAAPAA